MFNASSLHRSPPALVGAAGLLVVVVLVGAKVFNKSQETRETARVMTGGDAANAPQLLRRFGCAGCHEIPGIAGADGKVGGTLSDIRKRVYIGGVLTNNSDHLVQWIVDPQRFSPQTAMPATGISEAQARDVAAYLYSR